MNTDDMVILAQVGEFLEGTRTLAFRLGTADEGSEFVQRTRVRFGYLSLGRADKGLVLRYLCRVSGYSRPPMTRLVEPFRRRGRIQFRRRGPTSGFPRRYTAEDVRLLAQTDELHGTLCGPATKRLFERACEVFGQGEYQRLAEISVSHVYTLRQSPGYRRRRTVDKTRPVALPIGERCKPHPQGQPRYLRLDTVHQGDLDRIKGLEAVLKPSDPLPFWAIQAKCSGCQIPGESGDRCVLTRSDFMKKSALPGFLKQLLIPP